MSGTSKTVVTGALTALVLCAAGGVFAGPGEHTVQVLNFAGDSGVEHRIRLDSEVMGFQLTDLVEGETRSVTMDDGQAVTLTRSGESISVGVAGEAFEIPLARHAAGEPGHRRVIKKRIHAAHDDSLLIVSGKELDEATRETIRSALAAAGIEQAVEFVGTGLSMEVERDECEDDTGECKIVHMKKVRISPTKAL